MATVRTERNHFLFWSTNCLIAWVATVKYEDVLNFPGVEGEEVVFTSESQYIAKIRKYDEVKYS